MKQPTENKEPRQFLINYFSQKLAASVAISMRRYRRCSRRGPLREARHRTSPNRASEGLSIPDGGRQSFPHDGITDFRNLGKCLTDLRVPHPSRGWISRRMAACEFFGSISLVRRSNGVSGSSSLLQRRLVGRRTVARAQPVAASYRSQERSGSMSRLFSRRMQRGPFRTNLAGLDWFGSSALINLLVVYLAGSADSRCPSLRNQGPQRASNAAHGPNSFLLRPAGFPYTRPQGLGWIFP